jgi:ADP-dependent NAD(P)H-hydrate dehydratase / NAD(P)H-hydrate epimerase
MKLATADDMKKMDGLAVKDYGLTVARLMESAGTAVVRALAGHWPDLKDRKVAVLCGKGNNGGDGLAAARMLKMRKVPATVVLLGGPETLGPEPRLQYQKAKAAKVPVFCWTGPDGAAARKAMEKSDLLVDALFGTGLSRPLEGEALDLLRTAKRLGKPVAAVDIPSGLSADSGCPLGDALPALFTVTFGLSKPGFYTPTGAAFAGRVLVDDIGLPPELLSAPFLKHELTDPERVGESLPSYDENTHKGTRGKLLLLAGSTGLTGAAVLSAYGAQRIGAGLVTVGCPESLNGILEAKLTEPMTLPLSEAEGGVLSEGAEEKILRTLAGMDAVVIGPGVGRHPETGRLLRSLLPKITLPMVLDADALYLLGGEPGWFRSLRAPVVLTPHPGEASSLLGISTAEIQRDRVQVAKQMARDYNGTAVLKGRFTVIAGPEGHVRINPTGNRGLATGGTGDVLSGMIGGLLAQGLSPFEAAASAVFIHGWAGERASRRMGPDGLLAGDLLPLLPRLLRSLREKPAASERPVRRAGPGKSNQDRNPKRRKPH